MKFIKFLFIMSLLSIILNACSVKTYQSTSKPITHELWDTLVQAHVSETGKVNYKGFIQDSVLHNNYLTLLSANHPNEKNWTKDERLAYWINAYNAFTVKLIVDNYPTKSIKDIKSGLPFINSVWDIKFIKIENATYDLNNIEHGIVRKKFKEPRIHAAMNCASISCPRLRNEAYTAERLDEQLTDQFKYFLANPVKNKITADAPQLSKLFSKLWYGSDFTDTGLTIIEYLNQYSAVKINADAKVSHLDYNWNLNE